MSNANGQMMRNYCFCSQALYSIPHSPRYVLMRESVVREDSDEKFTRLTVLDVKDDKVNARVVRTVNVRT